MTISFALTSINRRHATSESRVVPAASVWEPARGCRDVPTGTRVRTLTPVCSDAPVALEGDSGEEVASNRREMRRENRRSFLLGAALGFTLVAGSLHLLMEEAPDTQTGYASTVTAEFAK